MSEFGGPTYACEFAVDRGSIRRQLGEGSVRLFVLALCGQRYGGFKSRSRLRRPFGQPILVTTPPGDGEQDQDGARDNEVLIPLQKLLELVSAYLFINFLKNIRHVSPLIRSPEAGCKKSHRSRSL